MSDPGAELNRRLDDVAEQAAQAMAAVGALTAAHENTSVGKDEFAALRSELRDVLSRQMAAAQAELQRRAAMLDAAIADAKTNIGERLDQMAALVAVEAARAAERALQQRFRTS